MIYLLILITLFLGIRLNDIVQMATEKENIEPEFRMRTIESLARHIEAALRYQHTATSRTQYTLHRVFKCFNLRYYESYVTGLYLVSLFEKNYSYF